MENLVEDFNLLESKILKKLQEDNVQYVKVDKIVEVPKIQKIYKEVEQP